VESTRFVLEIKFTLDKECLKLLRLRTIKSIWFLDLGFGVFSYRVLSGIVSEVIDGLGQMEENSVLSIKSFFIIIIQWSSARTNSCVVWVRGFWMFYGRGT
jgi:hypothetical protein